MWDQVLASHELHNNTEHHEPRVELNVGMSWACAPEQRWWGSLIVGACYVFKQHDRRKEDEHGIA